MLSDKEFREAQDEFGDDFEAKMGAEAVRGVCPHQLEDELEDLYDQVHDTKSKQIKKKLSGLRSFKASSIQGLPPSGWCLTHPRHSARSASLGSLKAVASQRVTSTIYTGVINRNNRLKNLLQLKTPGVIIHNEKHASRGGGCSF